MRNFLASALGSILQRRAIRYRADPRHMFRVLAAYYVLRPACGQLSAEPTPTMTALQSIAQT
jgi:hypothetical protein